MQEYNKLRFGDQSAGGGIGAALVEQLRDSGCIVIATDVVALRRVAGPGRSTVHARALDVTDPAAVDALVAEVETQIGPNRRPGPDLTPMQTDQAGHIAMSDLYVDGGATLRG